MMRLGAAIIVMLGACIAAFVLLERRIDPEVQRIETYLQSSAGSAEEIESAKTDLWIVTIYRGVMRLLGLCGVIFTSILFYSVSSRRFRFVLPPETPMNEADVMRRLIDRDQSRFQYGTLSLLALMLAVALVCSAIVYPLK